MRTRPDIVPRRIRRPGMFSGGDGSTLSLDFTSMSSLDSRFTFSRSSPATFINSSGLVQYANANMIRYSEDCASWGGAQNITPTSDAATAPNGTQTADQLNLVASSYRYQTTSITNSVGASYVGSIWMRTVSGTASVGFRIANSTTGSNSSIATCNVTETWQRFNTPAFTLTDTANRQIDIGIDQRSIVSGPNVAANIYVWGLQLQPGTSVGEYLPTTTTEDYSVPRFDYDPSTLAPRGLLIEGSATNLWTYSQDQSQWAASNVTVNTGTQATAPDGTTSLFPVRTNTTSTVQYFVRQRAADSITATAGQVYTYSMFVKKGTHRYVQMFASATTIFTSAAQANFDLDDGTTGNVTNCTTNAVSYGNGWWRLSITVTANASATQAQPFVLYLVSSKTAARAESLSLSSQSIYVWGAQVEQGSGASSYIPTGASTVQRAADSCTMTGTNFSSWFNATEGTFLARGRRRLTSTTAYLLSANDATNSEVFSLGSSTTGNWLIRDGGSDVASISPGTVTANTTYRIAGAYAVNDAQAAFNGTLGTQDTSLTLPTVNQLDIGRDRVTVYLDGHVELIKYWPTRLPDAQLQAITV